MQEHHTAPLNEHTPAFAEYLARHDQGCAWARANRALIAHRFMTELLGAGGDAEGGGPQQQALLDCCHNCVVPKPGWPVDTNGKP